jgi:hypothetical protein
MEAGDVMMTWQKMEPAMKEAVLISSSLVLVIFLILIWAIFLRKPSRRDQPRHGHRQHRRNRAPERAQERPAGATDDATAPSKRRRWRRRRREHRPRNPTLSETGGLPPFRSEGPPSPMA